MTNDFQATLERTAANLAAIEVQSGIRHEHFCLHCGYEWRSYRGKHPRWCARCHVKNFDLAPVHRDARKPGDRPEESWTKGRKRPQKPPEPKVETKPVEAPPPPPTPTLPLYMRAPFSVSAHQPRIGLTPPPRLAMSLARPLVEPQPEQIASHAQERDE